MLNEIAKNIYLVEVPLPKNPLRALNCYFIKNGENILVVDSGFDHEESEKVFFDTLEELGAKVGKTDMFLTHLHESFAQLLVESFFYVGAFHDLQTSIVCKVQKVGFQSRVSIVIHSAGPCSEIRFIKRSAVFQVLCV